MSTYKIGDKVWAFLANHVNDCTLDIISPLTTFLHKWEIVEIFDENICLVSDCHNLVIPRRALIADLYKTKEECIEAFKLMLDTAVRMV